MASFITAGNATNGLQISSDNTGILQLKTGTGAGTTAVTVDASQNTTLAGTLAVGAVTSTGTVTAATGTLYPIVSGTATASTSGTSIDFTSIPAWVKRVTILFAGLSTSGTSNLQCQVGISSGVVTSGYTASATNFSGGVQATATSGMIFTSNILAANLYSGRMVIETIGSNTWVGIATFASNSSAASGGGYGGGSIALAGTLDRVRITTVNGTDTFDAGSINILYE